MKTQLVFGFLVLTPFAAMADLACSEVGGGGTHMSLKTSDPTHVLADLTESGGWTMSYSGLLNTADPGVFAETVYDLTSSVGEKAKLTVTEMPSLVNGFCGRGICKLPQEPAKGPVKGLIVSATLMTSVETVRFNCLKTNPVTHPSPAQPSVISENLK